jgi:hypothetical protein
VTIPESVLMAYADGELSDSASAEVEAAMASDPALAAQVDRYRAQRARLQAAFSPALDEPVPARLLATARGMPVIATRRRWTVTEFAAMAASLLFGVALTWGVLRPGGDALVVGAESGLLAQGMLAEALDAALSGEGAAVPVQVTLSFRNQSGAYCRTFALRDSGGTAGLACRAGDAWQVRLMTRGGDAPSDAGPYRQAASALPDDVRRAVDASIAGEPLEAGEEAAARARGWRD